MVINHTRNVSPVTVAHVVTATPSGVVNVHVADKVPVYIVFLPYTL